jgi:hypothetical protein
MQAIIIAVIHFAEKIPCKADELGLSLGNDTFCPSRAATDGTIGLSTQVDSAAAATFR